jgi:flavin-dependent dehydrogenase
MRRLRRLGVEHAFAGLLAAAGPDAVDRARGLRPVTAVRGWAGLPGFARESSGPGWALVGDAGYFKDPITSHGITDALRDAELLAGQVLASRSGAVPEHVALARYRETRDRLSRELFAVTERVAAYDWDAPGIRSLLRRFSAAMGDEVEHLELLGQLARVGVAR